jgi:pimeloyl-ACP methyl ester carboxylesterase
MDTLSQLLSWIGEHEAVLSGIAAALAIVAVVLALSSRTFGLFRRSNGNANSVTAESETKKLPQEIRYTRVADGLKIAWSSAGSGYPLVRSLGWFTNLEMEWDSPISSDFFQKLASRFQLIRYDGRGMGLSDRDVTEFTAETRLEDLEAVIDASGVERFALLGMSEGGSTAIKYAAKHPERVSHLVLWGTFLATPSRDDIPQIAPIGRLVPKYWGSDSTAFHQMFTATFLPDGNAADNELFNEMQRTSATPETAAAFLMSTTKIDVRDVAGDVKVPALVLHRKGDLAIPVKYGKEVAAELPNSKLVLLDGRNHWIVTEDASIDHVINMIEEFVNGGNGS